MMHSSYKYTFKCANGVATVTCYKPFKRSFFTYQLKKHYHSNDKYPKEIIL